MKKIRVLCLVLLAILIPSTLTSCKQDYPTVDDINFKTICRHTGDYGTTYFLKDNDTNIVYIMRYINRGGSISVYVNADGNPMTYEEFQEVHHH